MAQNVNPLFGKVTGPRWRFQISDRTAILVIAAVVIAILAGSWEYLRQRRTDAPGLAGPEAPEGNFAGAFDPALEERTDASMAEASRQSNAAERKDSFSFRYDAELNRVIALLPSFRLAVGSRKLPWDEGVPPLRTDLSRNSSGFAFTGYETRLENGQRVKIDWTYDRAGNVKSITQSVNGRVIGVERLVGDGSSVITGHRLELEDIGSQERVVYSLEQGVRNSKRQLARASSCTIYATGGALCHISNYRLNADGSVSGSEMRVILPGPLGGGALSTADAARSGVLTQHPGSALGGPPAAVAQAVLFCRGVRLVAKSSRMGPSGAFSAEFATLACAGVSNTLSRLSFEEAGAVRIGVLRQQTLEGVPLRTLAGVAISTRGGAAFSAQDVALHFEDHDAKLAGYRFNGRRATFDSGRLERGKHAIGFVGSEKVIGVIEGNTSR